MKLKWCIIRFMSKSLNLMQSICLYGNKMRILKMFCFIFNNHQSTKGVVKAPQAKKFAHIRPRKAFLTITNYWKSGFFLNWKKNHLKKACQPAEKKPTFFQKKNTFFKNCISILILGNKIIQESATPIEDKFDQLHYVKVTWFALLYLKRLPWPDSIYQQPWMTNGTKLWVKRFLKFLFLFEIFHI